MADMQIVPAGKNVEAQYVEMMVPLYSYGCEKKVKKALANLKGIYSVNVDYHQQKVTVWGICDKDDVFSIIKSKRRGARFWESEDNVELDQDSHSAPPSPEPSSLSNNSKYYLAMIKRRSLNLNLQLMSGKYLDLKLSMIKNKSMNNWRSLKKAFARSNSF